MKMPFTWRKMLKRKEPYGEFFGCSKYKRKIVKYSEEKQ